ncbi:MAG TPA: hypothetical protein GYA05_02150 [Acholeplasmataceae bacterium]|nr:hypothetical protein [Acholeplasmataceae bacterium]
MEKEILHCKQCGKETDNKLELVTLKTMVDRGFRKNKYYQAMGDIVTVSFCDECIDRHVEEVLNPKRVVLKLSLLSAVVLLGCSFLFWFVQVTAFRVFCGIIALITALAFFQELKRILKKTENLKKQSEEERRKSMAVDLATRHLPKRHEDAELAYVDIRRVMRDNLELLGKEYGFSYNKLVAIRDYLRKEKRKLRKEENETEDGAAE